jgi:short-subunit dehydrogenase
MHALITGASSGIGEAIARNFSTLGWQLTLVARRESKLQQLAGEMSVRTSFQVTDLSNPEHAKEVIREAQSNLGFIDILINNAGIQYTEPTADVTPSRFIPLLNTDLVTPMALIYHVLPSMLEGGKGVIVNISSIAGVTPTPGMCHYNAAKAGLAAASESLRVELKATGVHVLTVYPGPVSTPMEKAAKGAYEDSLLVRHLPTGTADGLAHRIHGAILRRQDRVFYPRIYALHRHARVLNQWVTDRVTPPLKKGKTPHLGNKTPA